MKFQEIESFKTRVEKNTTAAVRDLSALFFRLHNVMQNLETQSLEIIRHDTIDSLKSATNNYATLQNARQKFKVSKNLKEKLKNKLKCKRTIKFNLSYYLWYMVMVIWIWTYG